MTVELRAADARVELAPDVGGAIASFTHGERDVLRPASDDARASRGVRGYGCYPLVPYSNRIANARLAFGEKVHELARNFGDHPHAIHGVGWQQPWTVTEHEQHSALLALEHRPEGDAARAWPWPFDTWQSFALSAAAGSALLTVALGIRNVGGEPFPFGLGWHPYFPRDERTLLGFDADGVWQTDDTQLPTTLVAATGEFGFEPPRAIGASALDNVFTGWGGEASLVDASTNHATSLRADRACAFVVVYAPLARGFVAIEPVTHMTDAFNRARRGEAATGTRVLAPGAVFSCTMQIASHLAP